jgi:hypothetical protein
MEHTSSDLLVFLRVFVLPEVLSTIQSTVASVAVGGLNDEREIDDISEINQEINDPSSSELVEEPFIDVGLCLGGDWDKGNVGRDVVPISLVKFNYI